ncbi:phage portal protein, partial [Micrococcus luteus]|nr:phage portal protein [Micrococcus luteus]
GVYVGISPLDVLRDSLKFQDAVEDFSLGEMKKKDKFIIQYDRSMDEPKIQSFLQQFRDLALKNGGAIIQQAGFKVERYASSFQPTDLNTTEALARTRIANAFNVPLSFLNDGQ